MAQDKHRSSDHQKAEQHGKLHDARGVAADVARRTAAEVDANPLGILVGGLAVGVLAGALVPRSAREKEILAPFGGQLGRRARSAFEAAKGAGVQELDNRGLTRDGLRDQAKGLVDGLVKALSSAGAAAAQSSKQAD